MTKLEVKNTLAINTQDWIKYPSTARRVVSEFIDDFMIGRSTTGCLRITVDRIAGTDIELQHGTIRKNRDQLKIGDAVLLPAKVLVVINNRQAIVNTLGITDLTVNTSEILRENEMETINGQPQ